MPLSVRQLRPRADRRVRLRRKGGYEDEAALQPAMSLDERRPWKSIMEKDPTAEAARQGALHAMLP